MKTITIKFKREEDFQKVYNEFQEEMRESDTEEIEELNEQFEVDENDTSITITVKQLND